MARLIAFVGSYKFSLFMLLLSPIAGYEALTFELSCGDMGFAYSSR